MAVKEKSKISYDPRAPKGGAPNVDEDDLCGTSLGRYLIMRRLGKGGMGIVYEAEDSLLNRRVAVKLLPRGKKPGARMLDRFFVEAQVAARLNHPNIIGIFDIGERSGTFYIVMELLNELSLGGYLRKHGPLPWQEATRITADCCAALHDAHRAGLVHRDIKPDNILCSPSGAPKVADFGLVKELTHVNPDGEQLTLDNAVLGSPQYMSPEQCRAQPVDSRSDIYSLGATYYSMLTGRPLFGSRIPMELMLDHCSSPPPDPREFVRDIPQTCVEILQLALQKQPAERFHSAEEMRTALETILSGTVKIPYTFLVPANTPRQPARKRSSGGLRAALEDNDDEGLTLSIPEPAVPGSLEKSKALSSSDERRLALLEAALAMAPTAPIARPTRRQIWRERYGKAVLLAGTVLATLAITILSRHFGQLLGETPVVAAAVRSPLKVGILHSLSGSMSPVARPVVDATLLAIDELNEQGGLLGGAIEAVVVDGKSDAETFGAATERLVSRDKVQVIFGGLHPDGRRRIRQIVESHDHLLLVPGDTEGLEESPNVFYLGGVPSQRIEPALRYSIQKLGYKRFFLLGASSSASRALNAMLHDQITELGGKVVGERVVARGALDLGGALKKISSAEPQLIINTFRGDANVYFFRAWQQRDKRLRELPVLSLELDENILTLLEGTDLSQNYLAGSYFQLVSRPENTTFVERFRKKYGLHQVVTESMEAAYSSVYLWAQAVRTVGDLQMTQVRSALKSQTLQGPSAMYRFDPSSNYAWKKFHLVRIGPGNRLELLDSSPDLIRPQLFPESRTRSQWDALFGSM